MVKHSPNDIKICQLDNDTALFVSDNSFIITTQDKKYYCSRLLEAFQTYILLSLRRSPARHDDHISGLISKIEKLEEVMQAADTNITDEWRRFVNDPVERHIRSRGDP